MRARSAPAVVGGGLGGQGVLGRQLNGAVAFEQRLGEGKDTADNVRQVGSKTFYHKENRWIDSEVTPEQEAKATVIEQFSDAYFNLAKGQSAERNQYLGFEEPVTVNLGGTVYRIERPKTK